MCGIAGVMRLDGRPVERETIEAMCRAMVHRGPDDEGVYLDGAIGLGHRRLSIIDRAAGHQPLCNEDGTVWVAYNGEIYNYRELRDELIAQGHRFRTQSDTEVIVHLYEDLGAGCVQRLQGMFAFAVWDARERSLLVARDRLGIKPLYYVHQPGFVAFASEMRSLLTLDDVEPRLDPQGLHDYLSFRYTVAPLTAVRGLYKLPPAHVLRVQNGNVTSEPYWDLDFSKKLVMSEADLIEEFRRRLEACTRRHLMAEVPLGVLLSGGIDSTVITGLVARAAGKRVKTFAVGFAGEEETVWDERPYARLASERFETDHYELALTGRQYADSLETFLWSMEEPMADPSAIPLYYISELAGRHVTVILSGEGSDEALAGYSFHEFFKGFRRATWARRLPAWLRDGVLQRLNDGLIGSPRVARYLEIARVPERRQLQVEPPNMTALFSEDAKRALYADRFPLAGLEASEAVLRRAYRQAERFELLDQMLYAYTKQWLPEDLLVKADKMTMAHSLELRVPFLDHTIVEFAASLPVHMKVREDGRGGYVTKYILRKAMADVIPTPILERQKLGFHVPIWRLFGEELGAMARDVLHARSFQDLGLFRPDAVERLFTERDAKGAQRWWLLWPLVVFATWQRLFKVRV